MKTARDGAGGSARAAVETELLENPADAAGEAAAEVRGNVAPAGCGRAAKHGRGPTCARVLRHPDVRGGAHAMRARPASNSEDAADAKNADGLSPGCSSSSTISDALRAIVAKFERNRQIQALGRIVQVDVRELDDALQPVEERRARDEQLSRCRNPFSCPHGRPTFVRMSVRDIEKLFKRVQ